MIDICIPNTQDDLNVSIAEIKASVQWITVYLKSKSVPISASNMCPLPVDSANVRPSKRLRTEFAELLRVISELPRVLCFEECQQQWELGKRATGLKPLKLWTPNEIRPVKKRTLLDVSL